MDRIYLDYNATTPVDPRVLEAMLGYYHTIFGNPSSINWYGKAARKVLDEAREKVALFIKAKPSEIVFTSCGTEANNLALFGIVNSYKNAKKNKVIISAIEHHSIMKAAEQLENKGIKLIKVPVSSDGIIHLDKLFELMDDNVLMVSVIMANNETGVVQPIKEIAKFAQAKGIIFHTDAVQAAGKINIDVEDLGC